jgi:hypothetical protein
MRVAGCVLTEAAVRRARMQHGWTVGRATRPPRHDWSVLTGPRVSWRGPRSADVLDQVQPAAMAGRTPQHCRERVGAGG